MGSSLSPMVANSYMEGFEEVALTSAAYKLKSWFCYADGTFVVWSHSEEELQIFLDHLKSIHTRTHFTMEMEADGKLAFLDVLVLKRTNSLP